ncbi:hypothetical protein Tco_0109408 [Tanacetum coccineum]
MQVVQIVLWYLDSGCSKHTCGGDSLTELRVSQKSSAGQLDSGMTTLVLSWVMEITPRCFYGQKLLLVLVTPKTDPSFTLVITKPHMSWCMIRSMILPFSESLVLFVTSTNDSEDLGKLQPTSDIGIFVGYTPGRKGYRIYNKRTLRIMETIHVQFDEMSEPMDPVQLSTGPAPIFLTPGQISSWLVPNPVPAAP